MSKKIKMSSINKDGLVVSSILAGAAVYFGLTSKGNQLEDLAREAVSRVINDQVQQPKVITVTPTAALPSSRRNRSKRSATSAAKKRTPNK
jgi:hypothetical protein